MKWKIPTFLAGALALTILPRRLAAHAQVTVKHIQTEKSPIATAVWAADTLYVSGQLASSGDSGRYGQGNARGLRRH